jgi:anti-sigma28 factor (negative regulator of flagellin synthesis)
MMGQPKALSENVAEIKTIFSSLKDMLFKTPMTDEAKIQFLKDELSQGRYEIQSHTLAEKLLEHLNPIQNPELEEIF